MNVKIALLGVGSALITAIALSALAAWQSGQYGHLAQGEVNRLIDADLDHIAQGIYNLVEAENEAVQQEVDNNLNVARRVLDDAGGVRLAPETVPWTAVNQLTGETVSIQLPKMLLGSRWLGQNALPNTETPVVDDVTRLVGGTTTIFQRMNERGDMLRVATTVTNKDGQRAIGTYIPALNPDDTPNPVISTILQGDTYHGRAFVVDAWNLTCYAPITNDDGGLIGMLYVGIQQKVVESRIRHAVLQTTVGTTGYVYVLSGLGEDRGHYIVSKDGRRDGEDIWRIQDSNGRYVIQDIINRAVSLAPGERATIRYMWKNPGDATARLKVARLAYYEPWDWVIGASTYEDELQAYRAVLDNGRTRMTNIMLFAGLAITILVGLLAVLTTWTITRPLHAMTQVTQTIASGDLTQRVEVGSHDEIGHLAQSFNTMTTKLAQTIDGLRRSEEKYRDIFENAIEGLYQTTLDGHFLSASPAMARILGYESPEALIAAIGDLRQQVYVHPEDRDSILTSALCSDSPVAKEVQMHRKDGKIIWTLLTARAMRNNEGRILFLQGFLIDITERKQTEAELHRISKLQSAILNNSTAGIALVRKRCCDWMNPRMAELFRLPKDVPQQGNIRDIFPDHETYKKVSKQTYLLLTNGKKATLELQVCRYDATPFWCRLEGKAVDPANPGEGVIWTAEDITERRQAVEELQRVSKLQSAILENSTAGIALVRNRAFEWVNPRMPEIFGLSPEQCQGLPTRTIYPNDESYQKVTDTYPILAAGKKASVELELCKGDGTLFWCRLEGKAVDPANPEEGTIWIAEDITERKRTQEALGKRLVALTRPLDTGESITFDDLFDVKDIQRIQDEFSAATRVASIITCPDGTPITTPSNFCHLCNLIRQTEKGRCNCYRSDAKLGRCSETGPAVQPCLSGGLWDAGAAIHVGGKHIANWLIGQVRDETQTEENMREYARDIGADEEQLLEAFRQVPSMSRAQFEEIAQLLYTTASQLSAMAYQNVQQSRFIAERQRAEDELRRHRDRLEDIVRERTAELMAKNNQLAQDIAERKRVEWVLQETSDYLNNLLDCANAPIIVWSPDLCISRFNHAFEQLTGRRAHDVLGHKLDLLFPPDHKQECLDHIRRATRGERWDNVELPIQHVDGTVRILLCNSAPIFEADGKTVTSTIAQGQDITERKRLEVEALQRQKLESVGQLAAGIAHEINTPTQFVGDNIRFLNDAFDELMRLIASFDQLDAAARRNDVNPALLDAVEQAKTATDFEFLQAEIPKAITHSIEGIKRISKIVYAMKNFSHPDMGEKTVTDLNQTIETTVTVARNEWKYVAEVELKLDPNLPPIPCFPGEINQVILNLIVNAAHAITDKLGPGSSDMGKITISTCLDNETVEIRIADTGTGIAENNRDKVFTPFFTTKSVGKGTGQGLAMAYTVIHKKHAGTIRFETEVGKGTTFIIRLPAREAITHSTSVAADCTTY